jgi:ubiquinone/menaquinone biosynthesis C-methylase UbiE
LHGVDGKLEGRAMRHYWSKISRRHLAAADDGLAAICYAGMPVWFNRFLDVYQRKAMARLLKSEDLTGTRILDVGTGVGRWARWFAAANASEVVGVDLEPARLDQARRTGEGIAYLEMAADDLAFSDASFDVVNSVTVLQHVEDETKRAAIAEFARVMKPGGRAVIFEISQPYDDAAHVFPWAKRTWEREFAAHGFELRRTVGDQYTPLLRMMKTGFSLWKGENSRAQIAAMKDAGDNGRGGMMQLLRLAVMASYPIEEVARFLPSEFAKITGFLFIKK